MQHVHKVFFLLSLLYALTLTRSSIQRLRNPQPRSEGSSMLVQPLQVLARAAQTAKMASAGSSGTLRKISAGERLP